MRKLFIGLAAAATLLSLCGWAWADTSGTCGNDLTWTLTEDGLLTISGTGDMDDYLTDSGTLTFYGTDDGNTNISPPPGSISTARAAAY